MYAILFYLFAAICILMGMGAVFVRKIVYALLALLFTFLGVAGLYVMLGADFVGVAQLLVYVGGVLTLLLSGLALTGRIDRTTVDEMPMKRSVWAIAGASALASVLLTIIWTNPHWKKSTAEVASGSTGTIADLGHVLAGDNALMLVAGSIAILMTITGAAMIVRAEKPAAESAERPRA